VRCARLHLSSLLHTRALVFISVITSFICKVWRAMLHITDIIYILFTRISSLVVWNNILIIPLVIPKFVIKKIIINNEIIYRENVKSGTYLIFWTLHSSRQRQLSSASALEENNAKPTHKYFSFSPRYNTKNISLYLFCYYYLSSAIRYFSDESSGSNYLSGSINNERMNYRK